MKCEGMFVCVCLPGSQDPPALAVAPPPACPACLTVSPARPAMAGIQGSLHLEQIGIADPWHPCWLITEHRQGLATSYPTQHTAHMANMLNAVPICENPI